MKLAKSIFMSAILLALAMGSAHAISDMTSMESATEVVALYDVDDDHDGRTDRTLELQQSDSLA